MKRLIFFLGTAMLLGGWATAGAQTAPNPSETSPTAADAAAAAVPPTASTADLAPVLEAEARRIAVMDRAKDAVLAIFDAAGEGGGSGVVISPDGYALTNFHVVQPSGHAMKCGMADRRIYDAVLVGVDPTGDVALIKLFGRDDFPHAEPADSDQAQVGDWCFAMGNPFLLAIDFQPTVTYGIISGTHRYQYPAGTLLEYTDCLQTDASINPGNSGGPLFDGQGRLIGINGRGSFEKRGRVNVGAAYAVSINQIKNFLGYLHSGRIVDHATLGAQVDFDDQGRVVVSDILEQSDAYRRGLRYDDEIVSFGGRPISTPNGFKNVLGIYPKGWRVPLSYRRDGRRYDVLVRLEGLHTTEDLIEQIEDRPPTMPMPLPKPEKEPQPGDEPPGGPDDPGQPPEPKRIEIPDPGKHPPMPMPGIPAAKPPVPEIVQQHFEARRGYANYYYNKLHRDRVYNAWAARAKFADLGGTWTVEGPLDNGGQFRFELTDDAVLLKLPTFEVEWTAGDDFGSSLLPPQSGGLLPALNLWRRLAVAGPGKFGEVTYLGTVPLAGHAGLVDVLVALHKGVRCQFYFDPIAGDLLAMEMYPGEDADPCEIYFQGYHEVDGRFLPARMEVRYGDEAFATFRPERFTFEKAAEK